MTTSSLVLLILLVYLLFMLSIGRLAKGRITSFQDAVAAPGQTSLLLLAGCAVAGQIGSGFVVGGAEYGARYGIGGGWYGIGCGLSYFAILPLVGFIYRHQFLSLSDYFVRRYRGKSTRLLYSVSTMCCGVATLAGQLLAGRAVFLALGIPASWGVVLTAVVSLAYANVAGLWGAMAASTIQAFVILFGMIGALIAMLAGPGFPALAETLPASCFRPMPFGSEFFMATVAPIILASPVNQMVFQCTSSARSARTARGGYALAGLVLLPVALIPPLLGMFGRMLFPGLPASGVFMELLLTRLPTAVAAIILAAIVCAVITSCNTGYIAIATIFVHDIYQGMIAPQTDGKTCKRIMLAVDGAVCLLSIFLALRMNDIIRLLSMGYSLLAAGCLIPFLGGMVWKRGNTNGALFSAAVGITATLANTAGVIQLPYICVTSIILSAIAYIAGSLLIGPDNAN